MRFDITALYCCLDDFTQIYDEWARHHLIGTVGQRRRDGKLSLSEMLLIMILFHTGNARNFKTFYHYDMQYLHRGLFKELPSYERFVVLQKRLLLPLTLLLMMLTKQTTRDGVYVIDTTALRVCDNKRIKRHKVFAGLAKRSKTTMGWFFGFKLPLVINRHGEIVAVKLTPGNADDRAPMLNVTEGLAGILLADKGYISKEKVQALWKKGLKMLVGIRKNMKNYLMPIYEKLVLRKRFIIETVIGVLKEQMGMVHTRHRSVENAFVHIISCLGAYCFRKNKPKIRNAKSKYQIT